MFLYVALSNKSNEKDNKYEYNFILLKSCKKSEDIFIENRKFTSGYNIKILLRIDLNFFPVHEEIN